MPAKLRHFLFGRFASTEGAGYLQGRGACRRLVDDERRWGCTGLPVMDDEEVVGIVAATDLMVPLARNGDEDAFDCVLQLLER